ncbi:MAG: PAS domain S-box protein, partial [Caldiserica bacterium]|nr:PAS domain S-box protein [Caldisericota bacterium]
MAGEEELFRQAAETTNEGIWILDRDFRVIFANRRMAEMIGWAQEEMIGQPVDNFIPESELADHQFRLERRKSGISERYERLLKRRDGSLLHVLI